MENLNKINLETKEIKNFWWEEELQELLKEYTEDDLMSNAVIILFILKIIETEKNG